MSIIGLDGKPLNQQKKPQTEEMESHKVPVLKWGEFLIPMRVLTADRIIASDKTAVTPQELVNEYRAMYQEMQDRFSVLAIGLSLLAKSNPDVKEFFDSAGLTLKDFTGKTIYGPEEKKDSKEESSESEG